MTPAGGKGGKGKENEVTQMHARVRNRKFRRVDNPVGDGYEVNVDGAVYISPVSITVRRRINSRLYPLQFMQHPQRHPTANRMAICIICTICIICRDAF